MTVTESPLCLDSIIEEDDLVPHMLMSPSVEGISSPWSSVTSTTQEPHEDLEFQPGSNATSNYFEVITLDEVENDEFEQFIGSHTNRTKRASTDPPGTVQRAASCGVPNRRGPSQPNLRRVQSDCPVKSSTHRRRFTGGCLIEKEHYQDDSIESTIQCTSIYVLDLITSEENQTKTMLSPVSIQDFHSSATSLSIFDDDTENDDFNMDTVGETEKAARKLFDDKEEDTFALPSHSSNETTPKNGILGSRCFPKLPSVTEIISFFHEIHDELNLEREVIIIALLYMERLAKANLNRTVPTRRNWRSILYSSIHLAKKVWGENQASQYGPYSRTTDTSRLLDKIFSEQRIDKLEWALLRGLNYNVKVTAKDFAQFYFLVQSKMITSDCSLSFEPMDLKGMKLLEDLSSRYERQKKKTAGTRRVKSMENLSFLLESTAFL